MFTQDQVDAQQAYWAVEESELLTDVFSYTINFDDTLVAVCQPTDAVITFDYDADASFTEDVSFSVSGNPSGSSYVFSQSTVNSDANDITLTLSGLSSVGTYPLTITASYGTVTRDYSITLTVFDNNFSSPTLNNPSNGAINVSDYTLNWLLEQNAASYNVEIATDVAFTNIVVSDNLVIENEYVALGLSPLTEYFWRVSYVNLCGSSTFSSTYSFTTDVCSVCTSVATTEFNTSTTRVIFNTIDNASGKPSGYSDYTSISTDLDAGSS
jgi:hypothetical protein